MSETIPQWRQALNNANEIRLKRASLKRDIASGEKCMQDLFREMPEEIHKMPVYEMVKEIPRYGPYRASKVMLSLRISQSRTFGALTSRQIDECIRYFDYINGRWID